MKALRARKDIRGRIYAWFDGAQGWILVAIIGFLTACLAFFVDVTENVLFDYKEGYCTGKWSTGHDSKYVHFLTNYAEAWYYSKKKCCLNDDGICCSWA